MAEFWTELRAVDSYQIKANGTLSEKDFKIITMLYQPLMGADCLALYQTFFTEIQENRLYSETHAHTQLLNLLAVSLQQFFQSRIKLEGLGLLKTYIKKENHDHHYLYELFAPLSAQSFFSDGLLNFYLYSKVGKRQYARLKAFFTDNHPENIDHFQEITRSFQDVFESFTDHKRIFLPEKESIIQDRASMRPIELDHKDFDFKLFYKLLSPHMISRSKITAEIEEILLKLVAIYKIDEKEMVNFVYRSCEPDGSINTEKLRKIARDSYQLVHRSLPTFRVRNSFNDNQQKINQNPETGEKEVLELYYEKVSPFQVLVDLGNGAQPPESELKLIEDIMINQKIPMPVMNVLIEYVITLRLDGKFARRYMESTAAHWKRKNIKTAKEAMEFSYQEHLNYTRSKEAPKEKKSSSHRPSYRKNVQREVLPRWFKNEEKKEVITPLPKETNQALDDKVTEIKNQLKKER